MTDAAAPPSSRFGIRLADLVDVLTMRRSVVQGVAGGVCLLGFVVALVAPGLLPPEPQVGALVGLVAGLVAGGAAIAVDSGDAVVQGPRHIRALDAEVAGTAPIEASEDDLASLVHSLLDDASGRSVRVAVTPVAHGSVTAQGWTERLARAVARQPRRVLFLDALRRAERVGISQVADGHARLEDAVEFDPELQLAALRAGPDPTHTMQSVPDLWVRLPGDVEVAVAALPPLIEPGGLEVASSADRVLLLVEQGRSKRVDLLASLDALETTGTAAQVVLLHRGARVPPARKPTGQSSQTSAPSGYGPGAPPRPAPQNAEVGNSAPSSVRVREAPRPEEVPSSASGRGGASRPEGDAGPEEDRDRPAPSGEPELDDAATDEALRTTAAEQALTEQLDEDDQAG